MINSGPIFVLSMYLNKLKTLQFENSLNCKAFLNPVCVKWVFAFFFNTWRHMLLSMMQYFGNSGQTNRRCVIRHQNSGWLELGLESVIINININKQFGYVSHMGFKILELHTLALNTIQQVVILNSFFNHFCPPKIPF